MSPSYQEIQEHREIALDLASERREIIRAIAFTGVGEKADIQACACFLMASILERDFLREATQEGESWENPTV